MLTLKEMVNRILYPNKYNSTVYVNYLRSRGAKIGENTRFISPKLMGFDENRAEYIQIGNNCCITKSTILAHDYSWYTFKDAYNDILPDCGGKVVIGNNCFIGYESIVLKNTVIGDNVIIAAGAVVKGNVPSNTVWGGVPARQICTLDDLYKKKMSMRIEDAFYRYDVVNQMHKPSIGDMGMFALLFLKRTEENYNTYISPIEFNGICNAPDIRDFFFNTVPTFDGFEEFVNAYSSYTKCSLS